MSKSDLTPTPISRAVTLKSGVKVSVAIGATPDQIDLAASLASRRLFTVVRGALGRAGLRQSEVAEALGVDKSTVSRMMAGPRNLTVENAGRLLRVMGCFLQFTAEPILSESEAAEVGGSVQGTEHMFVWNMTGPDQYALERVAVTDQFDLKSISFGGSESLSSDFSKADDDVFVLLRDPQA